MIMPYANAEAMNAHLREISAEVAPGAHAVLVCDGAGWHQRGKKLALPDNITLLSLPPYSPELNPMENVRSEEHTSELQSLMRISYAVFCLKKKKKQQIRNHQAQKYHIIPNQE